MNSLVSKTIMNYAVAMIATLVAAQFGWDEISTRNVLEMTVQIGIQLVGFGAAIRGIIESRKDKVVVNGVRVGLDELPPIVQQEVIHSAPLPRRRSLIDIIKGL